MEVQFFHPAFVLRSAQGTFFYKINHQKDAFSILGLQLCSQ